MSCSLWKSGNHALFARAPTTRTARCSATAATRRCTSSARATTRRQRCGTVRLAWWTPSKIFRVQAYLLLCAGEPDNVMRQPAGVSVHKRILLGRAYGRVCRAALISTSTFHSTMNLQETRGPHSSGESFNSGNDASRWQTDKVPRAVFATSPPIRTHLKLHLHPNRRKNCALGMPWTKQESFASSRIPARGRLLLHRLHLRNRNRNPGS
jgi:hypothetical protein